jgi:hypothetical protein
VFYFFDDNIDTKKIGWKSILVRVSPGQFREIYHLQPTGAMIEPAFILKAGTNEILGTRDRIPGTGNYYYEDYFWFSSAGAVRLNLEAIGEATKSVLPSGSGIWKGGGLDMRSLLYRTCVWNKGDANCCPSGGEVVVRFRLEAGRVIVTSKHFDTEAKPED